MGTTPSQPQSCGPCVRSPPVSDNHVKLDIEHRVEEHVAAEKLFCSRRSPFARIDRVVAAILLLVGIAGVVAVGPRWWTLIWFVLAPLEFFNLLSIAPLVTRVRFHQNPKFREPNEIAFSEEGIYFKTPTIDSRLKWDLYEDVIEDDALYLLVYSKQMYSVIPKRCFQSPQDAEKFKALLGKHIGPTAT